MIIDEINGLEGIVTGSQTTYALVSIAGSQIRLNFTGKKEFHLKKNTGGTLQILSNHPLLLDHNEPWSESYINTKPSDPEGLLKDLHARIYSTTEGWRDWTNYISTHAINRNIPEGNGLLSHAPGSITEAIVKCCDRIGIETYVFGGTFQPTLKKILFIGKNYVIAEDFYLEATSSA
jgi:hypothetical protein